MYITKNLDIFAGLFGGLYRNKSVHLLHFYNRNLVWSQHWCFCTAPCLSTDMNLYLVCWASFFQFSRKLDDHKTFFPLHKVWDQIQHSFCYHYHWIHTPFHENGCSVVVFFPSLPSSWRPAELQLSMPRERHVNAFYRELVMWPEKGRCLCGKLDFSQWSFTLALFLLFPHQWRPTGYARYCHVAGGLNIK